MNDECGTQPFVLPKAPGDFGSATKAATIKYVFAEMARFNFQPAWIMTKVLSPYFGESTWNIQVS